MYMCVRELLSAGYTPIQLEEKEHIVLSHILPSAIVETLQFTVIAHFTALVTQHAV